VHEAASAPDRFVVQVAEMPDGVRYLCVARSIFKPSGSFSRPGRRYVLGFGCELAHAHDVIYSDYIELAAEPVPIGSSCRICERTDCQQRAFPPLGRRISVPDVERAIVPFNIQPARQNGSTES
jgi:XRE family transcriptional regulator, fatty acid utilization regulator